MARNSTRSTRVASVAASVPAPTGPSLEELVAAGSQIAGKELWKAQAAQFCKSYSSAANAIGFDDLKVGGRYHHAFKAWQALQA